MKTLALAVAAALTLAGCARNHPCRDGTFVVAVRLPGGSGYADSLQVTILVDGGLTADRTFPGDLLPNGAGNLEVRFPGGYPKGKTLTVTIAASKNDVTLASESVMKRLDADCEAVSLTLTPFDLALEGDLAGTEPDLEGVDLEGVDLATVTFDFAQAPLDFSAIDLQGCAPVAEDCFNGVDDDCDGPIDCADPDCAVPAVCVPASVGTFSYYTEQMFNDTCAPATATSLQLYKGDPTGGGCTTSGCQCTSSGCTRTLHTVSGSCPGGAVQTLLATMTHGDCFDLASYQGANLKFGAAMGTLSCASNGATAFAVNLSMLPRKKYCQVSPGAAGGCGVGEVCVPRGPNQCVIAAGSGYSCPGGYLKRTPDWFLSYSDGRSCPCTCNAQQGCNVGGIIFGSICLSGGIPNDGYWCGNTDAKASMGGACIIGSTLNGQVSYTGPHTVCCLQ